MEEAVKLKKVVENKTLEVDVIVVGCGLSGLASADHLLTHDPSMQVILLEASDRLGGRILDDPHNLGGEWLLSDQQNLLQLADRLSIEVEPSGGDLWQLTKVVQVGRKGRLRSSDCQGLLPDKLGRHTGLRAWLAGLELSFLIWKLDRLSIKIDDQADPYHSGKLTQDAAHELDSTTAEAYIRQQTRFKSVRDVLEIRLRTLTGHDLNRISMLYLLSYARWQGAEKFSSFLYPNKSVNICTVRGGSIEILNRLANQSIGLENVLLNHPVQNISFIDHADTKGNYSPNDKSVYVTTSTGRTFKCSRVILALPPSRINQIEFMPALPAIKKHLMATMSMGSTIKFILEYDKAYWAESGYSGEYLSNGGPKGQKVPITWLTDGTGRGQPKLVGLLGGRLAVYWSSKPKDDLKTAILDQLGLVFGSWATQPIKFVIKDWQEEPFVGGGTVCVPGVGTMHEWAAIRTPHGPVHFAGTETATMCMGTMSGAVQAGQRAAVEVMDEMRPQCLSSHDYTLLKEAQPKKLNLNESAFLAKSNEYNFSVFKWTILLPGVAIGLAYTALRLRDTYGHLLVPKW